jgi:hypothetical protein
MRLRLPGRTGQPPRNEAGQPQPAGDGERIAEISPAAGRGEREQHGQGERQVPGRRGGGPRRPRGQHDAKDDRSRRHQRDDGQMARGPGGRYQVTGQRARRRRMRPAQAERERDRVRDEIPGLDEQDRADGDGEHRGAGGGEPRRGGAAVPHAVQHDHDEQHRPGGRLQRRGGAARGAGPRRAG